MNSRRIAVLALVASAAAAAWYFFVYLTKWEWNRALVSALIFLAAEIALIGTLLLDRLRKLTHALDDVQDARRIAAAPRPEVLARLREADTGPHNPFAWLTPERSHVFVPVLLGAGIVLSAIAWAVERVARATSGPRLERALALRLGALAPPEGGLLDERTRPDSLFNPTFEREP
jgi:hypothetical protein